MLPLPKMALDFPGVQAQLLMLQISAMVRSSVHSGHRKPPPMSPCADGSAEAEARGHGHLLCLGAPAVATTRGAVQEATTRHPGDGQGDNYSHPHRNHGSTHTSRSQRRAASAGAKSEKERRA